MDVVDIWDLFSLGLRQAVKTLYISRLTCMLLLFIPLNYGHHVFTFSLHILIRLSHSASEVMLLQKRNMDYGEHKQTKNKKGVPSFILQ